MIDTPAQPIVTLRDHQILQISRDATGAGSSGLPVGEVVVEADPIETTQTDLAGVVTEARRARLEKRCAKRWPLAPKRASGTRWRQRYALPHGWRREAKAKRWRIAC